MRHKTKHGPSTNGLRVLITKAQESADALPPQPALWATTPYTHLMTITMCMPSLAIQYAQTYAMAECLKVDTLYPQVWTGPSALCFACLPNVNQPNA